MLFFLVITGLCFSTDAKSCYFAPYYDNIFLLDAYVRPHVCASPVWTVFCTFLCSCLIMTTQTVHSLSFRPPSLCAHSAVAVKSTQWVFVQYTLWSVCSRSVELAQSLLETSPGSQQTTVSGLKKKALMLFWFCKGKVRGRLSIHIQSHTCWV